MIVIVKEYILEEGILGNFLWDFSVFMKYEQGILDNIRGCIVREMTCRI